MDKEQEKIERVRRDAQLIEKFGGTSAFAKLVGMSGKRSTAIVANWKRRGIPFKIKVDYPHLFVR